jgi:hypothetical protein
LQYKIFHKEKTKKKHFLAQLGVFLMTVQEIVYFLKMHLCCLDFTRNGWIKQNYKKREKNK